MIKKIILCNVASIMVLCAWAQPAKDAQAIKNLCGCFDVSFNYAETFTNDTTVKKYAKKLDNRTVVEMVLPIEDNPKKKILQHILVGVDGNIIKHWREDWEYEKQQIWLYNKDKKWVKRTLPAADVKGKWLQTVWEVDDAPRYQGISDWVQTNNQTFWLNTTDAPLPRREYTKRTDYNVMERSNKIIVSANGWLHEQDNKKVIRKDGLKDSVLAEEKGYNKYVRIDDDKCKNALDFWTKEKVGFWQDVRNTWDAIISNATTISLQNRVDGKLLYEALGELEQKKLNGAERKKGVTEIINRYAQAQ